MDMKRPAYRIGVDIGGTFTDIVLISDSGQVTIRKVPSTPRDYGQAIVHGIKALLDDIGIPPQFIDQVTHGTTIASNAILEGHGARTALITTSGFRDVLELRRLRRPSLYDLKYKPPEILVPRQLRFEVIERIGADGNVRIPLDMKSVDQVCKSIERSGVDAVAICLLHAYANPAHEQQIASKLRAVLKDATYVTCSSDILREAREYERTSTTVVNAYLGPAIRGYLSSLIKRLEALGFGRQLQLMQSNGALLGAKSIIERPASIIESGPAAGVIGAANTARLTGHANVIAFDMGGTTAKAALIEDGSPAMTSDYEVGAGINVSSKLVKGAGHAVRLPFIDISEIGAGGGSLITFDHGGHLHVGPQSAGSDPGPVCYDRGGDRPTLTDAFLALGYLNAEALVGGELRLNAKAAISALELVAKRLNKPLLDACYGIYQLAASTMVRAVKAVTTYRGRDPRDFVLVCYGGNGPLVASGIAGILEMSHILVPPRPGVFSATGLLAASPGREFVQPFRRAVKTLSIGALSAEYSRLQEEVRTGMKNEGYKSSEFTTRQSADLRYRGQAYELTVPIQGELPCVGALSSAFGDEYFRTYGHRAAEDTVELVNIRIFAAVEAAASGRSAPRQAEGLSTPAIGSERKAYFGPDHGLISTPVISRSDLAGGLRQGPLIVEEYDSTCVVPPGCTASLDAWDNINIVLES
jgi:N-methylhydantoinase A